MPELLPLTVLEKFLYWENRPSHPWTVFCKYQFDGQVDRQAFQQAADQALNRHVLLNSRVIRRNGRWYWHKLPEDKACIEWQVSSASESFPAVPYIDLSNRTGLQLIVVERGDQTDVIFCVHHACCDGLGAGNYFRDLLINYANLKTEPEDLVELPKLSLSAFKERGKFGMGWRKFFREIPKQLVGLAGAWQFVGRNPMPILSHEPPPNGDPPTGFPHVMTAELDRKTTASIKKAAKANGCTTNDLLARDLFIAIDRWRSRRGQNRKDWIRMLIPMDVRTKDARHLPASNYVSSIFLDRRGSDFDQPDQLLQSIMQEMRLIKNNNLGMTFLFSLKLLNLIPGRLKKSAKAHQCTNSCIFSNLDRQFLRLPFPKRNGKLVIGNLVLERAWTVAPLRPYSLATFMSLVYVGQLLFTLQFDARYIDQDSADELLQLWLDQIKTSSISGTGLSPNE